MPGFKAGEPKPVSIPTTRQYQNDLSKEKKEGTEGVETPGAAKPQEDCPVESAPTIQPDAYADALEQADAGVRLALPQFAERIGTTEPAPDTFEVDAEVANEMATDLMEARGKLVSAGSRIRLEGNQSLHRRINDLVNQVDGLGAMLAERHAS